MQKCQTSITAFLNVQIERIKQWGISYERIPLTWKDLNSIPEQIYVLHLTPKEIVYTTDPNLKKLYNATVTETEDEIVINIIWLKCLHIQDINVWSNIVFAYNCFKFDPQWASKNTMFVDSMLLTILCDKNKNKVEIKPHIMNIVKPRISRKATSKHMLEQVSKIYKQLQYLQKTLSERDVYVTSWGIPLKETDIAEIMRLVG